MSVTIVSRVRVAERFSATFECGACRSFLFIGFGLCLSSGRFVVPFAIGFTNGRDLFGRECSNFPQFSDLVRFA